MKMSTVKILVVVSLCSLVGCTRVIRTDYIASPVVDQQGQQVGEQITTRSTSQYVFEN